LQLAKRTWRPSRLSLRSENKLFLERDQLCEDRGDVCGEDAAARAVKNEDCRHTKSSQE
jgi:hypothetical protein